MAGDGGGELRERAFFTPTGEFRVDGAAPPALRDALLFRMCYHRYDEASADAGKPPGWDRVRKMDAGGWMMSGEHFEEVFTSSRWLVRIYKVVDVSYEAELIAPMAR